MNVEVNNRVGVVISEAKRKELQAKLRAIQDADDNEQQSPAPSCPQAQPEASTRDRNAPSGAPAAAQDTILIMPGGEGVRVAAPGVGSATEIE